MENANGSGATFSRSGSLARGVSWTKRALDSIAPSEATSQWAGARVAEFNVNLHRFIRLAAA
jgi:hypothetical protein